ncbi:ribosome recycling factor [Maritalea mediterranea]|uniref:Ribosome-recycling factor n=1 Tax=Maritalea mediterranea TaxID=2909667 RepID=A0ABS9E6R1_9HYPH|nr:ribosome recycling factor [Maritalea mediterranea]MCF4098561.1 ribosome recycling factor [Maritalea mediterranea]
MSEFSLQNLDQRMKKSLAALKEEFGGLRTGRATTGLLDPIMVDAYGSKMPLNQVATVSVPEPRLLSVQVWDKGMTQSVEKAIRESSLGLNPMAEGTVIRVALPELNEERRKELTKVAHQYAEQAKVAIRHIRRDGMDALKKQEKDGDISKDDMHQKSDEVQKLTDNAVAEVDKLLASKEADIMQV